MIPKKYQVYARIPVDRASDLVVSLGAYLATSPRKAIEKALKKIYAPSPSCRLEKKKDFSIIQEYEVKCPQGSLEFTVEVELGKLLRLLLTLPWAIKAAIFGWEP